MTDNLDVRTGNDNCLSVQANILKGQEKCPENLMCAVDLTEKPRIEWLSLPGLERDGGGGVHEAVLDSAVPLGNVYLAWGSPI